MNVKARAPTTFTSREFNQNTAGAKRAAEKGPVFITDRGKPAFVLMSIREYERTKRGFKSLADALADNSPEGDFEWEPPRLEGPFFNEPELD
jgi:prevent-host-death family protein